MSKAELMLSHKASLNKFQGNKLHIPTMFSDPDVTKLEINSKKH